VSSCNWAPCPKAPDYGHAGYCILHYNRRRKGIPMDPPPMRRPYTAAEDEIILAEYRENGPWYRDWLAVGRLLGRSPASVRAHAARLLGLKT